LPTESKPVATSLRARMRTSLLGYWDQARSAQRFAYAVGAALVAAGRAHLASWLLVGGAWAAPVSFRKPTTFGISFGLTTAIAVTVAVILS
jgi:hypothetical protein